MHHAIPKLMGGKEVAWKYAVLDDDIHKQLHTLLRVALMVNGFSGPNRKTYEALFRSSRVDRGEAHEILIHVSDFVDKACIGRPGYKKIRPVIDDLLKFGDFDF